jgi:DNA-binding NarL/FixJ family response regulator
LSSETQVAPKGPTIDVMLVDDHRIWRDGVKSLLEDTDFHVIAEASSGKEAIEILRGVQPRMILLDIRMAGGDGLDTLQVIKAEHPGIAVVMLTTYDNPTYMARAVAGGAAGYLLKGVAGEDLLNSLRAVADGESLLNPHDLARSLRGVSENVAGASDLIKPLSERELEVLRLLANGLNNRDIAAILFISEGTVKTHVEHIIGKLGVSDRVQAVVWAARHGVISLDKQPETLD